MNTLKQVRNQFIERYDECQEEKDMHDNIILYYQSRYRLILKMERPLTQNLEYEETYLAQEFEAYRRTYESYYNKLCQLEVHLSMEITVLNERLGYDIDDLSSDEE